MRCPRPILTVFVVPKFVLAVPIVTLVYYIDQQFHKPTCTDNAQDKLEFPHELCSGCVGVCVTVKKTLKPRMIADSVGFTVQAD